MKRRLFLLLVVIGLAACVDADYDLSKIDTDNVAVGDEASEFRAPLATVHVSMSDIGGASTGENVAAMFAEADTWLPTILPTPDPSLIEAGYVALDRLDETAYVNRLTSALLAEMLTSSTKLDAVATLLSSDKYIGSFLPLLPGVTAAGFKAAFIENFTQDATLRQTLSTHVETVVSDYLATLGNIEPLDYNLGAIDLDDSVVDMLADNLDPEGTANAKNTLSLYGKIDNSLPLALTLAPEFTNTSVRFSVDVDKADDNPIGEVRIYASDLRAIVAGTHIRIPITLTRYYPGTGFDEQVPVVISLSLLKKGGLSINL